MSEVEAKIHIGIDNAKKLLKLFNERFEDNRFKKIGFIYDNFSSEFKDSILLEDYKEIYNIIVKNYDYDIKLNGNAFLQFTYEKDKNDNIIYIRYAYYDCPIETKTYEEFLKDELGYDYVLCGDEFFEEYDQYKTELNLKNNVTPIRYEYSQKEYLPLKHAISHLHIGYNNEVRIPMSTIITPCEFVAFILRHIYYKVWKKRMDDIDFITAYKDMRKHCSPVLDKYFTLEDQKDFYIA